MPKRLRIVLLYTAGHLHKAGIEQCQERVIGRSGGGFAGFYRDRCRTEQRKHYIIYICRKVQGMRLKRAGDDELGLCVDIIRLVGVALVVNNLNRRFRRTADPVLGRRVERHRHVFRPLHV